MTVRWRLSAALLCTVLGLAPSRSAAQSSADCLACHSDSSLTMERGGTPVSLFVNEGLLKNSTHRKLVCAACHTGFSAEQVPHKEKIDPVNCLTCHREVPRKHAFHPQLAEALSKGEAPDVSCKDCHGTHGVESPRKPDTKFFSLRLGESCGECHADQAEENAASAHGKGLAAGVAGAPDCLTCHTAGHAAITADADTAGRKLAQEQLCLSCHLDNPDVRAKTSPSAGFIASYEKSVHGSAILSGNSRAANCVDCHGSHEMKKGREVSAKVNKVNIPATCAACHDSIAGEYAVSVHGVALAAGKDEAPVCTSCHGEHNILRHTDPTSPVAAGNVSSQVCSPCHSSVALSSKYGLSSDRFKTFTDSYHGLAIRGGSVEVANCASCHGAHNIRSSRDSLSMVYKGNLAATCGHCHPGANERFAVGSVHVALAKAEEPVLYWIASTYIVLIVVVVGGMFLHNLLDFGKKSRRKLQVRRGAAEHFQVGHSLYVRMTLDERVQHFLLLTSFMLLVITGFMLRFPESWWVQGIRSVSDKVFDARSLIHRVAACVMVAASLYHVYYLAFTRRGRELFRDLLPRMSDAADAVAVMKFNLGLSPVKPRFGRFSYIEKSEYWALVWGTFVMAATGVVMWFDNTFIGWFTKIGYDISRTVHYYEAWLATLAIVIWHFYFVIFNPDVYPVNLAFWKGTLSEEEMAEEHPLELERIKLAQASREAPGETPKGGDGQEGTPVSDQGRSA